MKDKIIVKENKNIIIPCVPTRDLVVFPGMVVHFDVGREMSIKGIKAALNGDGYVFLLRHRRI